MRRRRYGSEVDVWPAFTDFVTSVSFVLVALLLATPWFFTVEALLPWGEEEWNPLKVVRLRQQEVARRLVQAEGLNLKRGQISTSPGTPTEQKIVFDESGKGGILFVTGRADLKPEFERRLKRLAAQLRDNADWFERIEVEGHTDDQPFREGGGTNWRLSTERAAAVVEKLLRPSGIAPWKFTAKGYAEYHPVGGKKFSTERKKNPRGGPGYLYIVGANRLDAARAANRRIEIRLIYAAPQPSKGSVGASSGGSGPKTGS